MFWVRIENNCCLNIPRIVEFDRKRKHERSINIRKIYVQHYYTPFTQNTIFLFSPPVSHSHCFHQTDRLVANQFPSIILGFPYLYSLRRMLLRQSSWYLPSCFVNQNLKYSIVFCSPANTTSPLQRFSLQKASMFDLFNNVFVPYFLLSYNSHSAIWLQQFPFIY